MNFSLRDWYIITAVSFTEQDDAKIERHWRNNAENVIGSSFVRENENCSLLSARQPINGCFSRLVALLTHCSSGNRAAECQRGPIYQPRSSENRRFCIRTSICVTQRLIYIQIKCVYRASLFAQKYQTLACIKAYLNNTIIKY